VRILTITTGASEFIAGSLVHANLSGAAFARDWLRVAGGEVWCPDRLRRLDPVGRELRKGDLLDFPPAAPSSEAYEAAVPQGRADAGRTG